MMKSPLFPSTEPFKPFINGDEFDDDYFDDDDDDTAADDDTISTFLTTDIEICPYKFRP